MVLSVPNLDEKLNELKETVKSIVESISENLYNDQRIIFDILSNSYFEYKKNLYFIKQLTAFKVFKEKNSESKEPIDLTKKDFNEITKIKEYFNCLKDEKKIKENFHGNRDIYNFIKETAIEIGRLSNKDNKEVIDIIEKYIERNFGGIDYEIDIDLKLQFNDIKVDIEKIKKILEDFTNVNTRKKDNKKKKVAKIKVRYFYSKNHIT